MKKYIVSLDLYGDTFNEEVTASTPEEAQNYTLWMYQEIFNIKGARVKFIWFAA